jgi:hypothetical protein
MLAVPTTTVSILRGTTTNPFGDVQDTAAIAASGIPASLLEYSQESKRPADRHQQTVRMARCRIPGTTTVQTGDRIKDENTLAVYAVDDSTQLRNIVSTTDLRLVLRRIT